MNREELRKKVEAMTQEQRNRLYMLLTILEDNPQYFEKLSEAAEALGLLHEYENR